MSVLYKYGFVFTVAVTDLSQLKQVVNGWLSTFGARVFVNYTNAAFLGSWRPEWDTFQRPSPVQESCPFPVASAAMGKGEGLTQPLASSRLAPTLCASHNLAPLLCGGPPVPGWVALGHLLSQQVLGPSPTSEAPSCWHRVLELWEGWEGRGRGASEKGRRLEL